MDFGGFTAVPAGMTHAIGPMPKMTRGVTRKNVDYTSSVIAYLEKRLWQRDKRDQPIIQPDVAYVSKMVPPMGSEDDPVTAITTKFVKTVYNKQRCPIFCTTWAPDGRRLIAGAASGEFSLWNGINLNFEALMKSHDSSVRSMEWSHNGMWMATTDDRGVVKYWQTNMNNVHTFQAHSEAIRGCSFSPMDAKLATCSDDGTVRVFDFLRSSEEFILRGHGADVKCVDWHPKKNLLVSGSKDNQQPIKLWDPKAGQSVSTIHAHKATVTSVRWNRNGTWLLTASRDNLIKLYDIRTMKELDVLKGHKSDVNTVSWHPVHEKLFASGGSDGAILFWLVGNKRDIGGMESPHDSFVWSLAWHPLGHMLCSGSNDHTCKFWCRNRPGDEMKDRFSSGGLPVEEIAESDVFSGLSVPGAVAPGGSISLPPPSSGRPTSDAITLPPPTSKSWNSNPAKALQVSSSEKAVVPTVDFQLSVLGADIIKEQFGNPPAAPGPPTSNQNPSPVEPVKSGLFMHVQGGGDKKEGGMGGPNQPPPGFGPRFPFSPPPSSQASPTLPHPNSPHHPPPGNQAGVGGMGPVRMRGPSQNFQGPRPPPPIHQNRREWMEGGGDFHGRPPRPPMSSYNDFQPRHFGGRGNSHLMSNPFSWQRQDPDRERKISFDEEGGGGGGRFPNEQGHNPYVYRRDDGNSKLRDPREQRMPPPGMGGEASGRGGENERRLSQDGHPPYWQNKGSPVWAQEHHGGPPPNHPGQHGPGGPQDGFHGRENKPPTQEHFEQRSGDFGSPRDQHGSVGEQGGHFPPRMPPGGPPHDRPSEHPNQPFREGENWRPQFVHERPLHDRPPHNIPPQGHHPQGPKFPPQHQQQSNFPPHPPEQTEQEHVHVTSQPNQGPPLNTPSGKIPPQQGEQRGPGGHVQDPRSQRAPPTSQPPQNIPGGPPQRPQVFPPERMVSPPNQPSTQPCPPQQQHPQFPRPGQHNPREGPPQIRVGPPQYRDGPTQIREGPPSQFPEGPPHRDGPPPPRDVPAHNHSQLHDGPPHIGGPPQISQQIREGPPQHPPQIRDSPSQQIREGAPQHIREGPPQQIREGPPQHIREGPPQHMREGPPQQIREGAPQHIREGPPQQIREGPPQHIREGPPQHMREGPPQQIREGPPQQIREGPPHMREGPPQQIREGPPLHMREGPPQHMREGPPQHMREGPPQHMREGPPQQIREGPPQHIRDGPPQQIREGPPQHIRDGPPQHPSRIIEGPPQIHDSSPQHHSVPQRFDDFHGQKHERGPPPPSDEFFQNQPGRPPSPLGPHSHQISPLHTDAPGSSQPHQFPPPHSRPPPSQNFNQGPAASGNGGPPPAQRFPAPHPPRMPQEQEHFHSPQHLGPQGEQGPPPNLQRPPLQQFQGPPPAPHMQQRDPPHHFDPPEQHRPPHGGPPPQPPPGPSDPRRQHPPSNFQGMPPDRGPPQNSPGPSDHFPPHHPHIPPQHGGPQPLHDNYNEEGFPLRSEPNWGHQQQPPQQPQHHKPFPGENRFEGTRDPHERRSSRGEVREGRERDREKRDRERDRDRDRERERDRERDRERERGHRERSPKHHRDSQPPVKRSRGERDVSKHGRREKRK